MKLDKQGILHCESNVWITRGIIDEIAKPVVLVCYAICLCLAEELGLDVQNEYATIHHKLSAKSASISWTKYVMRYSKRYLKLAPTCVWFLETNQ